MRARLLAVLGMAALVGGIAAVVVTTLASGRSSESEPPPPPPTRARPPAPPPPAPRRRPASPGHLVKLAGVAAFDPEGDRVENDDLAPEATDGDMSTYWRTEHYTSFFKPGVGLVLDARRPVRLRRLVLRTDTPGFQAQIQAGSSPTGPFRVVSPTRRVNGTTAFVLRKASPARYVLVWVTGMPDNFAAHVNEVTAFGR
jgi:putative peptidoglycan lipid II flippase